MAEAALEHYPVPAGRLTFVRYGENTTFRHDGPAGRLLVRVHRPQRHGREARHGALTVEASAAGETRTCSVLRWMDGRILERSARPVHLHRLGQAMARLHAQADGWAPPAGFVRMRWDHETFFGDVMVYGETPAAGCWTLLPREVRDRFDAVAVRAADVMGRADDRGLIHADLHLGNALFRAGDVRLIDFDDCGLGHRVYDLAVALGELCDEPGYPAFRDALLDGYRRHRDVDATSLDDFIAVRQVAFDLWFTGMAQVNPEFAARLDRVHRWSLSMLDMVEGPPT